MLYPLCAVRIQISDQFVGFGTFFILFIIAEIISIQWKSLLLYFHNCDSDLYYVSGWLVGNNGLFSRLYSN